jgi:recombination protein RecT
MERAMIAEVKQDSKHPMVQLKSYLEQRHNELRNALPAHMPPERFIRVVLTAVQQNPDLLACTRQSLWNASMRAAQDGLLPDGRDGAIVPYKDVATWMPMIGGLLKRFRNSGQFKSIATNVVRQGEEFTYWIDEHGEHMRHVPGDGQGELVKVYAMAETKDGGVMIRVMPIVDVEKRRKASKVPQGPMWRDWYEEAAMKTVLRNLAKHLPMSSDLDDLVRRDDDLYDFDNKEPHNPAVAKIVEQFGEESAPATKREATAGADLEIADEGEAVESDAFEAGREAKRAGMQRRAVPPEYRKPETSALARAWVSGWDDEDSRQ